MVTKRRSGVETREHVLQVARELFYRNGIRATGVDRVAAEAGVAPTTLYRLFASKDDLVAAYLEREDLHYREWFTAAVDSEVEPRARILAVFDALAVQVRPDQCRGCPFLIALDEIPDRDLASHKNAVTMKTWVRAQFIRLAEEFTAGTSVMEPAELADQLMLVMEGVYATVAEFGAEGPAARARDLVRTLLATDRPPIPRQ
ncbi:TetR/AcrR family transcriptional regulator [Nocardia bhagyanarayanae]|uniref:TetR family transcriptional regulator n=1 Tax=Nocardia bhagyanarayanae TaxID=1215925 RepID=A0A543FHC5_9NOCA|nr:TetR/AcrR family transcriptional regulator [Nocardia bhagyanarayanae]TQM33270.1 TetR family transcriptional regulator [Nocardia bhagyanarayanae]